MPPVTMHALKVVLFKHDKIHFLAQFLAVCERIRALSNDMWAVLVDKHTDALALRQGAWRTDVPA